MAAPAPEVAPAAARGGALHAIEQTLLGGGSRSLRSRAADAGWRPDAPDAWCTRCGGSAGPGEADATGCAACRRRRLAWQRAVRLGVYEGMLRDAIHALKYEGDRRIGAELGGLLGQAIEASLRSEGIDPASALLVPVPTTDRRRLLRNHGVDHTRAICRGAAAGTGMDIAPLLRRRHRPAQTGLSPTRRLANVRGAFYAVGKGPVPGIRAVVLIDDVRTTGATLTACCRALDRIAAVGQPADGLPKPEIWVATCAVSGNRSRRSENAGSEKYSDDKEKPKTDA